MVRFSFIFLFLCFFSTIVTKVSGKLIRKCALGTELVDWLLNLSAIVHTRAQTAGMWQALLEEGVLSHGTKFINFRKIGIFGC